MGFRETARTVCAERVFISRDGYDRNGQYWGRGAPLYLVTLNDYESSFYERAADREVFIEDLRVRYPYAKVNGIDPLMKLPPAKPEGRMTLREFRKQEGLQGSELWYEFLQEKTMEGVCPALCTHGCEVEPDGTCEHGNPSVLLEVGVL